MEEADLLPSEGARRTHDQTIDRECRCRSGKACYLTRQLAEGSRKSFRRRRDNFKQRGLHLSTFRCRECRHWHLGNSPKHRPKQHPLPRRNRQANADADC